MCWRQHGGSGLGVSMAEVLEMPTSDRDWFLERIGSHYVLPVVDEAPPAPGYLGVLWQAYRRLGFDHEPLAAAAGGVR